MIIGISEGEYEELWSFKFPKEKKLTVQYISVIPLFFVNSIEVILISKTNRWTKEELFSLK